jgi:hypothetical protein
VNARNRCTLQFFRGRRPDFRHCCVLFAFCAGWFSDNCLKKRYQFAGETVRSPGFTGWISVPFASLGGELAAIRVKKILIPARDRRRARTRRPNLH